MRPSSFVGRVVTEISNVRGITFPLERQSLTHCNETMGIEDKQDLIVFMVRSLEIRPPYELCPELVVIRMLVL
jgi:hypothetical protein